MKNKSRFVFIMMIVVNILSASRVMAFSYEENRAENYLSVFNPKEIRGQSYEEIKNNNHLDTTKEIKGGLYKYDVSQDGRIAVIYDEEDPTLIIYGKDKGELLRFDVMAVNGVAFCDEEILLFWKDMACGVFDMKGQLITAYELTALRDYDVSSKAAITYDKVCYSNERIIGSEKYWLTDFTTRKPRKITKHTEYSFLVRENEAGETTVLLRRMNTFWFKVLQIPIIILIALASLFVLNLQYHFFAEIRAFIKK